jgi:signal transduction histidine kinase
MQLELDDEKVKQVPLNLLRNAIEATGCRGRVTVRVGETGTSKHADTCMGLAIVHHIIMDRRGKRRLRQSRRPKHVFNPPPRSHRPPQAQP